MPVTDEQLFEEFDRHIDDRIQKGMREIRTEARRAMSRPPGAGPGDTERTSLQLSADQNFASWLGTTITPKSHYSTQLPLSLKAPTPITTPGVPSLYQPLVAPQVPALRLINYISNVPVPQPGASALWVLETSFTPGAAVVPETTLKPSTGVTFATQNSPFETVATIIKTSLQALRDMAFLQGWLDQRLNYAVSLALEDRILNAAAPNGLIASGVPLDPAFIAPGASPHMQLDLLAGAIAQLESKGYVPDAIVLSAADAFQMRILKTTIGSFLWADPTAAVASKSVWSVPVVISPKMAAGQFIVAALAQCDLYFVREQAIVEISYENEDDFVNNLACLRCECRGVNAVTIPAGVIVGNFATTTAAANAKK